MTHRLALVTGATSGIGMATCKLLAGKGLNLLLVGRNQDQLQLLKDQLSKQVAVEFFQVDLAQAEGRQAIISILHKRAPDIVINNAGFGLYGNALTYPTQEQIDILEVNGRAVLEFTLEAARTLVSKEKKGVILNVSSAASFQVFPSMAVYAASKAFVTNFSRAFDFEVKRYGVRVLTICPGVVATNFQKRAGSISDKHAGVMSPDFVAEQIWRQIERLDPLSIIDWRYRLLTCLSYLVPTSWTLAVEERIIAKRITSRTLIKIKQ